MKQNEEYAPSICEYYHTAPAIVEKIKALPDALQIFEKIYNELVAPCVKLIENGENEAAYEYYKDYVVLLQTQYI